MLNNIKISIIVPFYNSEKTIGKCVESIINQTCSNWELILVDDGSKDKSLEICNKFKKNDERIKILLQENRGVSAARNNGLKNATAEYIIFVDSDDYVDSKLIEVIAKNIEKAEYNFDLLVFGYYTYKKGNLQSKEQLENAFLHEKESILKYVGDIKKFHLFAIIYGKVFRKSIISSKNLFFRTNMDVGEDTCFVLDYISKINDMIVIDDCLYYVEMQSNNTKLPRNINNIFEINKSISETFNGKEYTKEKSNMYFRNYKIIINWAVIRNININDLCTKILDSNEFKEINKKYLTSKYDKLIYDLIKYNKIKILKKVIKIKNKLKN